MRALGSSVNSFFSFIFLPIFDQHQFNCTIIYPTFYITLQYGSFWLLQIHPSILLKTLKIQVRYISPEKQIPQDALRSGKALQERGPVWLKAEG